MSPRSKKGKPKNDASDQNDEIVYSGQALEIVSASINMIDLLKDNCIVFST